MGPKPFRMDAEGELKLAKIRACSPYCRSPALIHSAASEHSRHLIRGSLTNFD
jgi:hypothetical protein